MILDSKMGQTKRSQPGVEEEDKMGSFSKYVIKNDLQHSNFYRYLQGGDYFVKKIIRTSL